MPESTRATKLRRYDQVAAMYVNPNGISPLHYAPNIKLWADVSKGNKRVAYFSEFADNDPYRRGIAISRLAETFVALGLLCNIVCRQTYL